MTVFTSMCTPRPPPSPIGTCGFYFPYSRKILTTRIVNTISYFWLVDVFPNNNWSNCRRSLFKFCPGVQFREHWVKLDSGFREYFYNQIAAFWLVDRFHDIILVFVGRIWSYLIGRSVLGTPRDTRRHSSCMLWCSDPAYIDWGFKWNWCVLVGWLVSA